MKKEKKGSTSAVDLLDGVCRVIRLITTKARYRVDLGASGRWVIVAFPAVSADPLGPGLATAGGQGHELNR